MSKITGPIEFQLSKTEVELLKQGETISRELDTDLDGTTELQVEWHTVYESEGAKELFDEITEALNDE